MKPRKKWGLGLVAAACLAVTGCSGSAATPTAGTPATPAATPASAQPVTLKMAGWLLSSTPEFKTLTDAFHAKYPNVTINLVEYKSGNDYDTQMIADLAAGSAPDLYILKNLKNFYTYQSGKQLMDVSDVAATYTDKTAGLANYKVDGKTWAIPYRQDSWYLFYNKDMFDKAGVTYPDGKWTWADYASAAGKLTKGNAGGDVYGVYMHRWQSCVQGFANAQAAGADILKGNYAYMKPFYQTVVDMQSAKSMVDFGTSGTNSLTYQSQWGKQKAAMLLMGSWQVSQYLAQIKTGDAVKFKWGIAPVPQVDASTSAKPVTFGDPTAIGINPAIDASKVDAAKKFLGFIATQEAAVSLAGIGITPAYFDDAVTTKYFSADGVPTDDLSKFTFNTHDTRPENPVSANTAKIQGILNDMHTSIMSKSATIDDAIAKAQDRVSKEVLNK